MAEVKMPDNYIVLYNSSDKETADKLIQESNHLIYKIASDIRDEKNFEIVKPSGLSGTIKSGITNIAFYKFFVHAKGFYSTDKCVGCGRCVGLCPLNNISLKDKKPNWENNCTHCMACICGCPTKAIEYKNKTQTRERYYLK